MVTATHLPQTGKAQLVVIAGGHAGQTFPIGGSVVIGRGEMADIVLDDSRISRQHARIIQLGSDRYAVEDMKSRNGTMVNGMPIEHTNLCFGDKIQLGPNLLLQFVRQDSLEDQVRQRQRLETLGRLGAGVAHDLNNMLAIVLANLEFVQKLSDEEPFDREALRDCLTDLSHAVREAAALTPRFVAFSRLEPEARSKVDLSRVCRETAQLVKRTFTRSIEVKASIAPRIAVQASATELYQVLMNLCINARDAMPKGGELFIGAELREGNAVVTVRDTGMGMTEETRARIFEPFFTTKPRGEGFGMGLSTVRDLVSALGGTVEVKSAPDKGATFRVSFPATTMDRKETTTARVAGPTVRPPAEHGVILVVDDEALIRKGLRRHLRAQGYEVIEAADGHEGIEKYLASKVRPQLVILDLDMPRMSGDDALKRLLEIDPTARVVIHTGYPEGERATAALEGGAVGCLNKPCEAQSLLAQIELLSKG